MNIKPTKKGMVQYFDGPAADRSTVGYYGTAQEIPWVPKQFDAIVHPGESIQEAIDKVANLNYYSYDFYASNIGIMPGDYEEDLTLPSLWHMTSLTWLGDWMWGENANPMYTNNGKITGNISAPLESTFWFNGLPLVGTAGGAAVIIVEEYYNRNVLQGCRIAGVEDQTLFSASCDISYSQLDTQYNSFFASGSAEYMDINGSKNFYLNMGESYFKSIDGGAVSGKLRFTNTGTKYFCIVRSYLETGHADSSLIYLSDNDTYYLRDNEIVIPDGAGSKLFVFQPATTSKIYMNQCYCHNESGGVAATEAISGSSGTVLYGGNQFDNGTNTKSAGVTATALTDTIV